MSNSNGSHTPVDCCRHSKKVCPQCHHHLKLDENGQAPSTCTNCMTLLAESNHNVLVDNEFGIPPCIPAVTDKQKQLQCRLLRDNQVVEPENVICIRPVAVSRRPRRDEHMGFPDPKGPDWMEQQVPSSENKDELGNSEIRGNQDLDNLNCINLQKIDYAQEQNNLPTERHIWKRFEDTEAYDKTLKFICPLKGSGLSSDSSNHGVNLDNPKKLSDLTMTTDDTRNSELRSSLISPPKVGEKLSSQSDKQIATGKSFLQKSLELRPSHSEPGQHMSLPLVASSLGDNRQPIETFSRGQSDDSHLGNPIEAGSAQEREYFQESSPFEPLVHFICPSRYRKSSMGMVSSSFPSTSDLPECKLENVSDEKVSQGESLLPSPSESAIRTKYGVTPSIGGAILTRISYGATNSDSSQKNSEHSNIPKESRTELEDNAKVVNTLFYNNDLAVSENSIASRDMQELVGENLSQAILSRKEETTEFLGTIPAESLSDGDPFQWRATGAPTNSIPTSEEVLSNVDLNALQIASNYEMADWMKREISAHSSVPNFALRLAETKPISVSLSQFPTRRSSSHTWHDDDPGDKDVPDLIDSSASSKTNLGPTSQGLHSSAMHLEGLEFMEDPSLEANQEENYQNDPTAPVEPLARKSSSSFSSPGTQSPNWSTSNYIPAYIPKVRFVEPHETISLSREFYPFDDDSDKMWEDVPQPYHSDDKSASDEEVPPLLNSKEKLVSYPQPEGLLGAEYFRSRRRSKKLSLKYADPTIYQTVSISREASAYPVFFEAAPDSQKSTKRIPSAKSSAKLPPPAKSKSSQKLKSKESQTKSKKPQAKGSKSATKSVKSSKSKSKSKLSKKSRKSKKSKKSRKSKKSKKSKKNLKPSKGASKSNMNQNAKKGCFSMIPWNDDFAEVVKCPYKDIRPAEEPCDCFCDWTCMMSEYRDAYRHPCCRPRSRGRFKSFLHHPDCINAGRLLSRPAWNSSPQVCPYAYEESLEAGEAKMRQLDICQRLFEIDINSCMDPRAALCDRGQSKRTLLTRAHRKFCYDMLKVDVGDCDGYPSLWPQHSSSKFGKKKDKKSREKQKNSSKEKKTGKKSSRESGEKQSCLSCFGFPKKSKKTGEKQKNSSKEKKTGGKQ